MGNTRVQFLVAGTQKGGTSALNRYLKMHPQVCTAEVKEVHFFDNERLFRAGIPRRLLYRYYHSYFDRKKHHRTIGECTPIYMYWAESARRIWEYNPRMKFIILLRNPIDRTFSNWNMERDRSRESVSFYDAIQSELARCRQELPYQHRVFSYVDRGYYAEQLRRLWRFFPQSNTLVLKSEHLRNDPNDVLDRVASFLELDPFAGVEPINVNSRPYAAPMSDKERDCLREIFEHEIRALERMLNWDCTDWLCDKPGSKEKQPSKRAA